MKKKTKKFSLKKWFYNKILNRYLIEFHPQFILFADNLSIKTENFSVADKAANEYRRIMKILNSQKYKRFFYNSVKYDLSKGGSELDPYRSAPFKPFKNTVLERLKRFIAEQYLRFFNKPLYRSLLIFKSLSSKYESLSTKIDEYMDTTTVKERLSRAKELGVLTEDGNKDIWLRDDNVQKSPVTI